MTTKLLKVVLGACCALGLIGCQPDESLRFKVAFEANPKLDKGDPVVFKGIEIGKVSGVDLDREGRVVASVVIEPEYREVVTLEADYRVGRVGGLDGLRGERELAVIDRGGATPVADGAVVVGSEGELSDRIEQVKEGLAEAWDRAGSLADSIKKRFEDAASSEEAEKLGESLQQLAEDARERGQEGWKQLRDEEVPKLKEEARRLREQLEKEGDREAADKLWEELTTWLDSLEPAPTQPAEPTPTESPSAS
jgi:ABC-type transporter Mla subunit MlaD